jgi:hypothetical protein
VANLEVTLSITGQTDIPEERHQTTVSVLQEVIDQADHGAEGGTFDVVVNESTLHCEWAIEVTGE